MRTLAKKVGPHRKWSSPRSRIEMARERQLGSSLKTRVGYVLASLVLHQVLHLANFKAGNVAEAVSVQRLQVPDLLVIDQQQRPLPTGPLGSPSRFGQPYQTTSAPRLQSNQPEAASLIKSSPLAADLTNPLQQQQVVTFECLISFDRKKDRNLIVKWHHDERNEPIYQWIPELNKRTVAPPYRAFIAPILDANTGGVESTAGQYNLSSSAISTNSTAATAATTTNQVQLLEAGFRLVRPTKELGGRYTCSAISSQNDDSKSKKMIVYTPPKSFRFNASRTDISALLANQRDRLIQLTQPALPYTPATSGLTQLPLAYRTRGLDSGTQQFTTISPQMYSTIDYVNVNQQRASRPPAAAQSNWPLRSAGGSTSYPLQPQAQVSQAGAAVRGTPSKPRHGIKLVCDIDQVFPVPEVSIYRLARLDGAQPERLAKLETKIERDPFTGLFRVQVTSILDDDELANIRQNYLIFSSSSSSSSLLPSTVATGAELEIQFECVIALTNLELSKYADNKRSIIYRPGQQVQQGNQWDGSSASMNLASRFGSSTGARLSSPPIALCLLLASCALSLVANRPLVLR